MTAGNPYGCPAPLFEIIEDGTGTDMLRAIKRLGPGRMQFIPGKAPAVCSATATDRMLTTWALDGRRATVGEICRAAGIKPPAKDRGQVKEMA